MDADRAAESMNLRRDPACRVRRTLSAAPRLLAAPSLRVVRGASAEQMGDR